MGGALATLAAYDIRKELEKADRGEVGVGVACYSFGAPRTGNHAFARDYNHLVPDTWSIINDQASSCHQPHLFCCLCHLLLYYSTTFYTLYFCLAASIWGRISARQSSV